MASVHIYMCRCMRILEQGTHIPQSAFGIYTVHTSHTIHLSHIHTYIYTQMHGQDIHIYRKIDRYTCTLGMYTDTEIITYTQDETLSHAWQISINWAVWFSVLKNQTPHGPSFRASGHVERQKDRLATSLVIPQ